MVPRLMIRPQPAERSEGRARRTRRAAEHVLVVHLVPVAAVRREAAPAGAAVVVHQHGDLSACVRGCPDGFGAHVAHQVAVDGRGLDRIGNRCGLAGFEAVHDDVGASLRGAVR